MKRSITHRRFSHSTNRSSDVSSAVAELQQWIVEVSELGMPHFGELGQRLMCYRETLEKQFSEEECSPQFSGGSKQFSECSQELSMLCQQHAQFLDELDNMVVKLHQEPPPYDSWQDAVRQFQELQTEIERHTGREQQLVSAMTRHTSSKGQ